MDKLPNSTHEALGLRVLYLPDSLNKASKKRSEWDISRMLMVRSVKFTLTDKVLKVNFSLKVIFSVIEDQCSGGRQHFQTSSR